MIKYLANNIANRGFFNTLGLSITLNSAVTMRHDEDLYIGVFFTSDSPTQSRPYFILYKLDRPRMAAGDLQFNHFLLYGEQEGVDIVNSAVDVQIHKLTAQETLMWVNDAISMDYSLCVQKEGTANLSFGGEINRLNTMIDSMDLTR